MKSHLGCGLLCISWAPLELLTCLYEIPSRLWVAVHLLGFLWIADMLLWNPIQVVSCCAPLGLPFELLTCFNETPSRMWVTVHFLSSLWIADMLLWNPIQHVSCCASLGLPFNHWYAPIKSHPACELLCISWPSSESLTCSYESYPACELLCASWASFELLICLMESHPGSKLLYAF